MQNYKAQLITIDHMSSAKKHGWKGIGRFDSIDAALQHATANPPAIPRGTWRYFIVTASLDQREIRTFDSDWSPDPGRDFFQVAP